MIKLISFICDNSHLEAIKTRLGGLHVNVMSWQAGMQEVLMRAWALLPLKEYETDRWIFAWDDSPFSFGPMDAQVKRFQLKERDRIYYVLIGDWFCESAFEKHAANRLREIYLKDDGTPDAGAIAAHTFFVNERTGAGLERLVETLYRMEKMDIMNRMNRMSGTEKP